MPSTGPFPRPPLRSVWATLGLGVVIVIVVAAAQAGCLFALTSYTLQNAPGVEPDIIIDALTQTGFHLSLAGTVGSLVGLGAVFVVVNARTGASSRVELALISIGARAVVIWLTLGLLLAGVVYLLGVLLARAPISLPVVVAYQSAHVLWWFWITVVFLVPLFEELFFRGFLLFNLSLSRLRPWGAVLTTSVIWSLVHLQYDTFELGTLFVLGVVLGWVRLKTGSIVPGLVLHAVFNAASLVLCAYYL